MNPDRREEVAYTMCVTDQEMRYRESWERDAMRNEWRYTARRAMNDYESTLHEENRALRDRIAELEDQLENFYQDLLGD